MTHPLLKEVKSIVQLNKVEEDAFLGILEIKQFKKYQIIMQQGSTCQHIMCIEKGCIRYFYVKDGEEITGQFFSEDNWFTDFESYLSEKPSGVNIQALEECSIFMLSKKNLNQLYLTHPVFERMGRLLTENAFLGLLNHNRTATLLNPEERYRAFLKNRPELTQRVAQHLIASYLGIKPQSLSRIRKRIFSKE
jgi:CRP/FNR family transcriptional regulator, anaerobic regulatory protein